MKPATALIAITILLSSCATTHETLRKTRIYVGKYTSAETISDKQTIILTSQIVVKIDTKGGFVDTIPPGTLCYIDLKPCLFDYHPDIAYQLDSQYLVFLTGDEPRYRVVENCRFY